MTRRRVVGTAAHAAWVAPVIIAASAAPAFAASGPAAVTTTLSAAREGNFLTVTVTLTNANTQSAGFTTLLLTATPRGGGSLLSADPTFVVNDGWTFQTRSGNSGGRSYTFTKADVAGAPDATSSASTTFAVQLEVRPNIAGLHGGDLNAIPTVASGGATGSVAVWT